METETALNEIERAHQLYRDSKHRDALELYTSALGLAKHKAQKISLHSNRAACYLKLQDFKKAAHECTSVLDLDQQHTGALMLRAQTLVTLKDYQSALFDVNRLIELNPASEVYRNLQARLRTQLSLAPIPESEDELLHYNEDGETTPNNSAVETENSNNPSHSRGWEAIQKPKGHSGLDYSRWDKVENDSSEEEEDGEDVRQPQYRFRVRTVGVRPVK